MDHLQKYKLEDLVFQDETGIDDNEEFGWAWSKKGTRVNAKKAGFKKKRISIIGAKNEKKVIAPFVFEGSCNRELFENYLENFLVPELRKGQVVIMDNASFHKGGRIQEIIENASCQILYLPPYSPELNPIEKCWSWIKNGIRKLISQGVSDLFQAASMFFSTYK